MSLFLSPQQVAELIPGMNVNLLAQMRFRGDGPRYVRVTPRKIVYEEGDVLAYLESRKRSSTSDLTPAQ
jgi:hypothetical protein